MTIAFITAGAAGTVCGNCLQDNALAAALKRQGRDVVLIPAYTPLRTDEEDVSDRRVVFGGANLFLQGRYSLFRSTGWLDRLLDSPLLLRWASGLAVDTDPANLGAMTRDMFQGEAGPYRREMGKLVDMLRGIGPGLVHLTNSMLVSMAEPVRRELGVPVVCSLQGEADFLAALPESHRQDCYDLLRSHAVHVDRFVAPCQDQADAMAPLLGGAAERVETVPPGITLEGFGQRSPAVGDPFVIGFLARVAEPKGIRLLAEAVEILRQRHPAREVELRVAGWRGPAEGRYLKGLQERFGIEDRGYLSRDEKIAFLSGLDVLSVPATYRASKGLYVLEALAAGVPVVQPRIGVYPELVAATGGGLLCEPDDSADLAAKLEVLLTDPEQAARLGSSGRAAVLERFHVDRMAAETAALYDNLAA